MGIITARRGDGAGEHTISKELITLRAALKLAKRAGLWRGDIGELLPIAFAPDYVPHERWITPADLQVLLSQLLPNQAARIAFIVATSAGDSEAEKVLRADVTPATKESGERALLRGTKRPSRWRTVPIEMIPQRELLAYALRFAEGTGEQLFARWTNIRRDLGRACVRAAKLLRTEAGRLRAEGSATAIGHAKQLEEQAQRFAVKVSPNDLRRSFAHWLRAESVPLEVVAPLMGHTTTKMVQIVYGKMSTAELAARLLHHRCINRDRFGSTRPTKQTRRQRKRA